MKPLRILPLFLLLLALLAACNAAPATVEPGAEPTTAPTIEAPPTPTAIVDEPVEPIEATPTTAPTAVPPAATETPVPTAEAPGATLPPGAFTYALGALYDGAGWVLRGVVPEGDGWTDAELPMPAGVQATNFDYSPQIHQALTWEFTPGVGAGPANLASGPLVLVDFNTNTAATLIPEGVIAARFAPNNQGFAYLLASAEGYELIWRDPAGTDHTLASGVTRDFTFDPTGRTIAFTRESNYSLPVTPGLYVVDINSGEERQLSDVDRAGTGGSGPAWAPAWSPGGESVLLRAYADASGRLAWAEATGAWSHAITLDELDAVASAALGMEDVCNNDEFRLIGPTTLVFGAGPCPSEPLMGGFPEATHIVVAELDPATGALTPTASIPAPTDLVTFLDWDETTRTLLITGPNDPAGNDIFEVTLP